MEKFKVERVTTLLERTKNIDSGIDGCLFSEIKRCFVDPTLSVD